MSSRVPRELVFPEPNRPVPLPPGLADLTGAAAIRQQAAAANVSKLVVPRPCIVIGFLMNAGAATATGYLLDTDQTGQVAAAIDPAQRITVVKTATYDGWMQGPRLYAKKGLAFICDQIDAEVFIYIE